MAETSRFDPTPHLESPQDEQLEILTYAIQEAWSYRSSLDNGWRPETPAVGQSRSTALVVRDYLGGTILRHAYEFASGAKLHHFANFVTVDLEDQYVDLAGEAADYIDSVIVHNEPAAEVRNVRRLLEPSRNLLAYTALRNDVDWRVLEIDHSRQRERQRQSRMLRSA